MDYKQGIDVSKWQGVVDWAKVKAAGVDFAMLRAWYGQGTADSEFAKNAAGCEAAGRPYGVYWFSNAYSAETAAAEAAACLKAIEGRKINYPVAFDFEGDSVEYAEKRGVNVTKELVSSMARAFCSAVEAAGR